MQINVESKRDRPMKERKKKATTQRVKIKVVGLSAFCVWVGSSIYIRTYDPWLPSLRWIIITHSHILSPTPPSSYSPIHTFKKMCLCIYTFFSSHSSSLCTGWVGGCCFIVDFVLLFPSPGRKDVEEDMWMLMMHDDDHPPFSFQSHLHLHS